MNNRWVVAIAGKMVLLCAGVVYIWGVFQGPLVGMFGWTQAQVAMTFSLTLSVFSIGTIFGGRIQDKLGPREVAIAGGIMIGAGVYFASFANADQRWILYSTYGILMGFGVGTLYTPVLACVLKWFPDKKGFMSGLVVAFMGVGSLVFTPVARILVESIGVLTTFKVFGVVFGVLIVIAAMFLKNPPAGYKPAGWNPPSPAAGAGKRDYTPQEIIRKPHFYYLACMMLIGCLSGFMVIPFAKIMAMEAGLSDAVATTAIVLIGIANAGGRFFWGAAGDKIGRVQTMATMLAVGGICSLLLPTLSGYMVLIGIASVAFCFGGFLGSMPATVGEFFGMKNVGVNYGLVLLFFGVDF
jgi:OFA family oxalate/formate antiporter-like MFS transporter